MKSIVRKLHLLYNMLLLVSKEGFYNTHKIGVVFPRGTIYEYSLLLLKKSLIQAMTSELITLR